MRIATFNLQNLRLRTRGGERVLDGAADQDGSEAARPIDLARADRRETARVIAAARPDVLALQEVYDLDALTFFHDRFLGPAGAPAYPFRYCFPGNDGRGLNVAALSRVRAVHAESHARLTGADLGLSDLAPSLSRQPIFRRDCLELSLGTVTLFVCHFKAPHPDAARAHVVREAEARAVRKIVEARFPRPERARWIVLGDFNEPAPGDAASPSALAPLASGFAVDLLERLWPGADWTYELPQTHLRTRPDRILVSPRLADEYPDAVPRILRSGMASGDGTAGERAPGPTKASARASDHALVYVDFPGL